MDRWARIQAAVESVAKQHHAPADIVLAVDHNPELYRRAVDEFPGVTVIESSGPQGASSTRNSGAAATSSPLIAFLDDDAAADPDWLVNVIDPFSDPEVVGTGGKVLADWETGCPTWFPDEFLWVVGATFHDGGRQAVRNVWAENMAVRRTAFDAVGGFSETFGKVLHVSRPEDTDLCIRMSAADSGPGRWIYVPEALVHHHVPANRETFRFFLRRCYLEGMGKAEMSAQLKAEAALVDEVDYLRSVIPAGLRSRLKGLRTAPTNSAAQAASIHAGLGSPGVGFTSHAVRARRAGRRAS